MSDPLSPETLAEIEAVPREVADAMVLGTRANISYADAEELWSAMMDAWGRTLLAEVRRQTAEIERLRAEREWRPIETAPKDGMRLLLIDGDDCWPYVGRWRAEMGDAGLFMEDDDSSPDHQPTHWQPLPAPPISPEGRR